MRSVFDAVEQPLSAFQNKGRCCVCFPRNNLRNKRLRCVNQCPDTTCHTASVIISLFSYGFGENLVLEQHVSASASAIVEEPDDLLQSNFGNPPLLYCYYARCLYYAGINFSCISVCYPNRY